MSRRRFAPLAVLVLLALAGCLQGPAAPSAPAQETVSPQSPDPSTAASAGATATTTTRTTTTTSTTATAGTGDAAGGHAIEVANAGSAPRTLHVRVTNDGTVVANETVTLRPDDDVERVYSITDPGVYTVTVRADGQRARQAVDRSADGQDCDANVTTRVTAGDGTLSVSTHSDGECA